MYSDETRENLRTLLEAVENTTNVQVRHPSSAPASAPAAAAPYGVPSEAHQAPAQPYPPYPAPPGPGPPFPFGGGPPPPPIHGAPWQGQHQQQYEYHSPTYPTQHGSSMPDPSIALLPGGHILHPPPASAAVSAANISTDMQEPRQQGAAAPTASAASASSEAGTEASREDIEYILAKPFKSVNTGDKLGFPCYNLAKEMIGFIRESNHRGFGQFIPISKYRSEFGLMEMAQATGILHEAIAKQSPALHTKEEHTSVYSLIDHALVYDYSKETQSSSHSTRE